MKLKLQHFIRETDRERLSLADLNKRKYKNIFVKQKELDPRQMVKDKDAEKNEAP